MRRRTLAAAAVATLSASAGLAFADRRAPAPVPVPATARSAQAPVPIQLHGHTPARRAQLRARMTLKLADAKLSGRGRKARLSGRPTGRGRLIYRSPQRLSRRVPARTLADLWGGVTQPGGRVRAELPGGRVALVARPRMRRARAVFPSRIVAGRRGALGTARITVAVNRRVKLAGRCPLVPYARCRGRHLRFADLHRADLRGADLRGADLSRAFAHSATLTGADLRGADLRGANLAGARLRRADLRGALLADASLLGARLGDARVRGAHVCRTELAPRRLDRAHCGRPHPRRHLRAVATAPAAATPRATAAATRTRAVAAPRRTIGPPPRALSTQGCPYKATADNDDDGLADCVELAGWKITVSPSTDPGTAQSLTVRSRVGPADTDGDGLGDGAEYRFYGNPRSIDTDGDGLGDAGEVRAYAAQPNQADTDGDARTPSGNYDARLLDGAEADSGTSPALADTDGDALSDYAENQSPVFNPRVADLPQLALAPDPRQPLAQISVGYKVTTGGSTRTTTASTSSTSTESKQTHEMSVETSLEASQKFEEEGDFGIPPGDKTTVTLGFKESVSYGSTATWEDTQGSEEEYSKEQEAEKTQDTERDALGCFKVTLNLTNTSTSVTARVSALEVAALVPEQDRPGASASLGTLQPDLGDPPVGSVCQAGTDESHVFVLGPQETAAIPMHVDGDADELLDFMANPTSITYLLEDYRLTGAASAGQQSLDYDGQTAQDVNANTATVVVDRGDGRVRSYRVAANVHRDSDGRSVGVTLDEALGKTMVNLSPTYAAGSSQAITSLCFPTGARSCDRQANAAKAESGTWVMTGDADGIGEAGVAVGDIVLSPGDSLAIVYLKDSDDDRLPDNQENIHGLDVDKTDTDGDGLTDYFETQVGWTVPYPAVSPGGGLAHSHRVYSSALGCDADGDEVPDGPGHGNEMYGECPKSPVGGVEYTRADPYPNLKVPEAGHYGTDPSDPDTNFDGFLDGEQVYPEVLARLPLGGVMPRFVGSFGGSGSGSGSFSGPVALAVNHAVDAQGTALYDELFVADSNFVQKFVLQPGVPPRQAGQLSLHSLGELFGNVIGMTVNPSLPAPHYDPKKPPTGAIPRALQLSMYNHSYSKPQLVVVNTQTMQSEYGDDSIRFQVAGHGIKDFKLFGPLAAEASGSLLVANTYGPGQEHTTVSQLDRDDRWPLPARWSSDGRRLSQQFGAKERFYTRGTHDVVNNPEGIAVDANGAVFVSDGQGTSPGVSAFAPTLWGTARYDDPGARFWGVATGPSQCPAVAGKIPGYVYVADGTLGTKTPRVVKLSRDLTFLGAFVPRPFLQGGRSGPSAVAVDSAGVIYVADSIGNVVDIYAYPVGPDGRAPGLTCG